MNTILTILLWIFLALEVMSVLTLLMEAKKERPPVEPAVGCLAGGFLVVCWASVALLVIGDYPDPALYTAGALALSTAYSTAQAVRAVHDARGPRTPATTMLNLMVSLITGGVVLYLLVKVV